MLALLPLGALSVLQIKEAQKQVDVATLEGVGGAALQAIRGQMELINEAQISARVLATILSTEPDSNTSCVERVSRVANTIPQTTLVAFIPMTGLMTCSSNGRVYDFQNDTIFQSLIERPLPKVVYNPHGPVSDTAVIGVSHPVFDESGRQTGIVAISLSYTAVAPAAYADQIDLWRPSYLATFLSDGTVMLSSDPERDPATVIPSGTDLPRLTLLADRPAFINDGGNRSILSVVSVTADLYLLSIWERDQSGPWQQAGALAPYLLPGLTWIAALAAAGYASARLVVRHVRALSRSMSDYVSTKRRHQIPDMDDAPREIQSLHSAYEGMIRTIEQEEADLQNLLVDKDLLLREINHRSGNSLQIIASIMRMYRRETTDPKLRQVLDGLVNRVIALSSTHTSLYTLSGQRDVAMDVVLGNVVKRLKEIHGVALGVATKRFQPIRMDPQAAVPLALALAEAVGCYFAHPGLATDAVVVELSETDGMIRLRIEGPEVPELRPDPLEGLVALPKRMLRQFAAQLFGTLDIKSAEGRASVDLVFPRKR